MGRRRFSRGIRPVISSTKNIVSSLVGNSAGVLAVVPIAEAVDSATLAVAQDVQRGCQIRAIWLEIWVRAIADTAVGISTVFDGYLLKNPGTNLTAPLPGTTGTSNEKKFIFKEWRGLISSKKEGNGYYSWQGWIKIPKRYQRMGANDRWDLVVTTVGVDGISCVKAIYKWYL